MPKYVSFFSYSPEAARGMVENPQDRAAAAARVIESQGGRLESFYWMFGPHDGLLIADYPDAASAAAVSAAILGSGSLRGFTSYQLIGKEDVTAILKKAKTAAGAYRKPGA